ncbi:MAG TPA: hypothetical protein DCZ95_10535 [Verrucomicrobia bacterium]|nr:MAG: hypothetical protein A2X46_18610 [Lentisphaerae bacterium GWF2_57_35]HBA84519.1 hypothetical protein [Verrucomicrobiota bacterium]
MKSTPEYARWSSSLIFLWSFAWASIAFPDASLYGYVRNGPAGIPNAQVILFHLDRSIHTATNSDAAGLYLFPHIDSSAYYIKVEATNYADEWYYDANIQESSQPFNVQNRPATNRCDFDLAKGQAPAFVRVYSDPTNALIYVDYQATTSRTPAIINIGEAAPRDAQSVTNAMWLNRGSHMISVYAPGYPLPPPQKVPGLEAETCWDYFTFAACDDYFVAWACDDFNVPDLCMDSFIAGICRDYYCHDFFYLLHTNVGAIQVQSTPAGAEVFVDRMDASVGSTPVTVTNLFQGWHTVFLRRTGYLQPRPIRVFVEQDEVYPLQLNLTASSGGNGLSATVKSVPTGASNWVDGFIRTNLTDNALTHLDPTPFSGSLHYAVSHLVALRKNGYLNPLFQYADTSAATNVLRFSLLPAPNTLGDRVWYDSNSNGLQNAAEPGASNIVVQLYDGQSNLLERVTTDSSGCYLFHNLAPGDYIIEFFPPAGYLFSKFQQGAVRSLDSDVPTNACRTPLIALPPNKCDSCWDAGLIPFKAAAFWFRAVALTNNIVLRWESPKKSGLINQAATVRYHPTRYPTNLTDGTSIYTGTNQVFEHTGLTPNQPCYYTIWVSHNGIDFQTPP